MREFIKLLFVVLVVLSLIGTVGGCQYWKWNECRKVGHGRVYCAVYLNK